MLPVKKLGLIPLSLNNKLVTLQSASMTKESILANKAVVPFELCFHFWMNVGFSSQEDCMDIVGACIL
jgi:hypothetical protein